jgi:hypothetical protein
MPAKNNGSEVLKQRNGAPDCKLYIDIIGLHGASHQKNVSNRDNDDKDKHNLPNERFRFCVSALAAALQSFTVSSNDGHVASS